MGALSPDVRNAQVKLFEEGTQVLQEAEAEGIKPVQFIRSTVLKRLNGTLVDVRGIDAYIKQRDRDDILGNRRQL